MKFNIHRLETAPGASKQDLRADQKAIGFIPNLLGVLVEAPCEMPQLESETAVQEAVHRIFEEQSSQFYWLAYLLTGDSERAVQAFTSALEFGDAPTPVFREFMISWARKLVIASALGAVASKLRASALRFVQTESDDLAPPPGLSSSPGMCSQDLTQPELHCALLAIDIFPRCALLLTIFEKLSVKDAALLLDADERLVRRAQASALIDLTRNLAPVEVGAAHRGELSVGVGCQF